MSNSFQPHGLQCARLPCPSPSLRVYSIMSIESVMPSIHLILCCPFLLLPSIFPSIRVFSSESVLRIRWPKYWSFSNTVIRCLKRVRGRRCDEEGNMSGGSEKDVKMKHCWLWRWKKGFEKMEEWTKEGLYSMYHVSGIQKLERTRTWIVCALSL